MENKNWITCVICLFAIFIDVTGNSPNTASLLLVVGFFGFFVKFILKKIEGKMFLKKICPFSILIFSFPVCIFVGILFQKMALVEAEDLRILLMKRKPGISLNHAYSDICSKKNSGYCGFYTYKIIPKGNDDKKKDELIVMQFFDKRIVVDVTTGGVNKNSFDQE